MGLLGVSPEFSKKRWFNCDLFPFQVNIGTAGAGVLFLRSSDYARQWIKAVAFWLPMSPPVNMFSQERFPQWTSANRQWMNEWTNEWMKKKKDDDIWRDSRSESSLKRGGPAAAWAIVVSMTIAQRRRRRHRRPTDLNEDTAVVFGR